MPNVLKLGPRTHFLITFSKENAWPVSSVFVYFRLICKYFSLIFVPIFNVFSYGSIKPCPKKHIKGYSLPPFPQLADLKIWVVLSSSISLCEPSESVCSILCTYVLLQNQLLNMYSLHFLSICKHTHYIVKKIQWIIEAIAFITKLMYY